MLQGLALAAAPTKTVLYLDRGMKYFPADTWSVAETTIISPVCKGVGVKATERAMAMMFYTEVAVIVAEVNVVGAVNAGAVVDAASPSVARFRWTEV